MRLIRHPRTGLSLGLILTIPLLLWVILTTLSERKRPAPVAPRVAAAPCVLEGKRYSQGALVRTKDGIVRCEAARWVPIVGK